MTINTTKDFRKQFKKLKQAQKLRFSEQIAILQTNSYDVRLNNHLLMGRYRGFHSINVGGDLRALYQEAGPDKVVFHHIGTHSQLYG